MPFDPVPWFVEGGAQHSAEVARLLAYMSTGGAEGVLNATDMRVLALSVPDEHIRVMPGACVILNRALASENQSYVARISVEDDTIEVPASGSSGPRTHLLVARVENPYISGEPWGAPPDVEDGPYIYPRLIPDVPIGTKSVHQLGLGYSAITLARITVPTNTATITNSMVTDLRSIANPVTGTEPPEEEPNNEVETKTYFAALRSSGGESGGQILPYTQTTFADFPTAANFQIAVPTWATHADVDINVVGIQLNQNDAYGELRLMVNNVEAIKFVIDLNKDGSKPERQVTGLGGVYTIPSGIRGQTVAWKLQARYFPGVSRCNTTFLRANESTYTRVSINFKQKAVMT